MTLVVLVFVRATLSNILACCGLRLLAVINPCLLSLNSIAGKTGPLPVRELFTVITFGFAFLLCSIIFFNTVSLMLPFPTPAMMIPLGFDLSMAVTLFGLICACA